MSNYELALTAGEIDIALQKAHNPDTSPQATNNLVTSGGVKTYVDGEVSTFDTRISAVEADVAAAASIKVATYSRTASTSYGTAAIVQLAESYDPNNIGAVVTSGTYDGGVRVSAGTYLINCTGAFNETDKDLYDYYTVILRSSGTNLHSQRVNEVGATNNLGNYNSVNFTQVLTVPEGSTKDINIYLQRTSGASLNSVNVFLTLTKLA